MLVNKHLTTMTQVVFDAGKIAKRYYGKLEANQVENKNPIDLVTVADKEIERFISDRLAKAFPQTAFLGEEYGFTGEGGSLFILDPIDGTTNFVRQNPCFAISLAYRVEGRTEIGLVYAPMTGTLWHAVRGEGAFKGRKRIHVSSIDSLIRSLAITGFACVRGGMKPDNVALFNKVIYRVMAIRRDGSAAIDLCQVAEGKAELFWEMNLNPYDTAAGELILREAGGTITDFDGLQDHERKRRLVASNGKVHQEFLDLIPPEYRT
jgi:myo-inositol-1(or 4)-monophosphatase